MFRKIRQTAAALKPAKRPGRSNGTSTAEELTETNKRALDEHRRHVATTAITSSPNIAVFLAIILPLSFLTSHFATGAVNKLFEPQAVSLSAITRFATVTTTALLSYLFGWVDSSIRGWLPFGKLNPFFGRKIEETVAALKFKTP